tara:strand:+ start:1041 stop:1667 length:627 start_codon:yes stop_codon:yes gene_type:complete
MKINICNKNKVFPFIYIDDWYTSGEEKLIWKELNFYMDRPTPLFHRAETNEEVARNKDGSSKSKAWRLYLDYLYNKREGSNILSLQPIKMQSKKIQEAINKAGPNFRLFDITNSDLMLINYYENADYYNPHPDNSLMTTICWFYRKPKAYTGGNITFTETDTTLECRHNRMVIFPSYYFHSVHPIKMKEKTGWGRYAIQNFYGTIIKA